MPTGRSQLSILLEHRAAIVANAPAMSGQRRATPNQIAPGHAARMIAEPGGGRLARRKFSEIDCIRGGGRKAEKQTCGYDYLQGLVPLIFKDSSR
jgi:hypothetical protein